MNKDYGNSVVSFKNSVINKDKMFKDVLKIEELVRK